MARLVIERRIVHLEHIQIGRVQPVINFALCASDKMSQTNACTHSFLPH